MELQAAREAAAAKKKAGMFGAIGSVLGAVAGAAIPIALPALMASDRRLKNNISHYDTLDNGIKLYTWEWNEIAIKMGAGNSPTHGVIAQDVREHYPEAVYAGPDGYLRVDYTKVAA
jgi:hypothetical protein